MHIPSYGPYQRCLALCALAALPPLRALRLLQHQRWLALCAFAAQVLLAQGPFTITTVAGSRGNGDGGFATAAPLAAVEGVAADVFGNVYLADAPDHRIRRVRPNGIIETVAGAGEAGYAGDGGPATNAKVNSPYGLAVDGQGNLYVADYGNGRVRRISTSGIISTVAGGGTLNPSYFGAAVAGTSAVLAGPRNLAFDGAGNLYISDYAAHRVLRLTPDGLLTHFAGTQKAGKPPDQVSAVVGALNEPTALAVDRAGAVYIADAGNSAVRRVWGGVMTSVNSTGAAVRGVTFSYITGLAIDGAGELYVAEGRARPLRRISPQGVVVQFGEGGRDVAVDASGFAYLADGPYVRRLSRQSSTILAGTGGYFYSGEQTLATEARLRMPSGLALDRIGNIYVSDRDNHRVRRIGLDGRIETIAGTGTAGAMTAAGLATQLPLNLPTALAVDSDGVLWIADSGNRAIRKVLPGGRMESAVNTTLKTPAGLAADRSGNLYISDSGNHRVYRYSSRQGLVLAVGSGTAGNLGDGSPPAQAQLNRPTGLALDANGVLYICDSGNARIRRLAPNGVMQGYPSTGLREPRSVVPDGEGGLYVADSLAHRVVWLGNNGARVELAGQGVAGFGGDGGAATDARLHTPVALLAVPSNALLIADSENQLLRALIRGSAPGVIVGDSRLPTALLSAASHRAAPAVPGSLMKIEGSGLGPVQGVSGVVGPSGRVDSRLDGVEVRFDGLLSPLLYVQDSLIHLQVPSGMHGRARALLEVWWQGVLRAQMMVAVDDIAPRLFLLEGADGQLQALNEDANINVPENPAERGSIVTLSATGSGLWERALADGTPAPADFSGQPRQAVTVEMDGRPAEVIFAGAAPGVLGTLQVNVRVPLELNGGLVPVVLRVGGSGSVEKATLAVR